MNNEDLLSGVLWLLGVATVFLSATAVAMAAARDGLVLWHEASAAVRALSTISTMLVAAVGVIHMRSGRAKKD
ncbi:MAG TPA: hypothetical protein VIG29_04075 [Vicinamibacteria bacterium]